MPMPLKVIFELRIFQLRKIHKVLILLSKNQSEIPINKKNTSSVVKRKGIMNLSLNKFGVSEELF